MPLPSFGVVGNLFDIPGQNDGTHLLTTGLKGRIEFTCNVAGPIVWGGADYWIKPVGVSINSDGSIASDDSPVLLLANDDGLNVTGIQWTAHILIAGAKSVNVTFDAPADGDIIDLAAVSPAPNAPVNPVGGLTETVLLGLLDDDASGLRDSLDSLYGHGGSEDEYDEYANLAAFPATGTVDHLYLAKDTGKIYRWTGSAYLQIADKTAVGLGNVDNTSDVNKPVSTAQQTALNGKQDVVTETSVVTVVGDSYSTFSQYYNALATATGFTANTGQAWGGRTATEIAVHFGGVGLLFTVAGGSIPATTTAAALTLIAPTLDFNTTYSGAASVPWTYHGTLNGVVGTLTQDPQTPLVQPARWQFTRTTAGSSVSVSGNAVFLCDDAKTNYNDLIVAWPGRNSVYTYNALVESAATQNQYPAVDSRQFIQNAAQSIERQIRTPRKRFLLLGVVNTPSFEQEYPGGTASTAYKIIRDYNAWMGQLYGARFFDVRRWLIDNATTIAAAASITLVGGDTTNINNDVVPASFFSVDGLHLATSIYTQIGTEAGNRAMALGFTTTR